MQISINQVLRSLVGHARFAVLATACLLASFSQANDGLDTNFGFLGANEINLSERDVVSSISTDGTGRIYVVGDTEKETLWDQGYGFNHDQSNQYIARFNSDGTIDPSFGGFGGAQPGVVVSDFQLRSGEMYGVTTLDDGKLMSVGMLYVKDNFQLVVSRYLENGWLDESFGNLGRQLIALPTNGYGGSLKRVNDKVYVWTGSFVARLDLDGTLDAGFGTGGIVVATTALGADRYISDVNFSNGSLIVASMSKTNEVEKLLIFQIDSTGNLVGGFGTGGSINLSQVAPITEGVALAVRDDLITVGFTSYVMRMDFAGNFDPTFGTDGVKSLGIPCRVTEIIHQPYGLTTIGLRYVLPSDEHKFGMHRMLNDGSPDTDFGNGNPASDWAGWLRVPYGSSPTVNRMIGYTNGKVLAVGTYKTAPGNVRNVALLRTAEFVIEPADPWDVDWGLQGAGLGNHELPSVGRKVTLEQELDDPILETEVDQLLGL